MLARVLDNLARELLELFGQASMCIEKIGTTFAGVLQILENLGERSQRE